MTKPHITKTETGEFRINGKFGAVTAFLRFLQPWMLTAVLIPGVLWTYSHNHAHKNLEEFASRGSRVYSSTGEDMSTNQLLNLVEIRIKEVIASDVPPEDVERRLAALEKAVEANHKILLQILQERRGQ